MSHGWMTRCSRDTDHSKDAGQLRSRNVPFSKVYKFRRTEEGAAKKQILKEVCSFWAINFIFCENFSFGNEQICLVSSIFNHLFGMKILPTLGKMQHGRYLIRGRGTSHAEIMNSLSTCICQTNKCHRHTRLAAEWLRPSPLER